MSLSLTLPKNTLPIFQMFPPLWWACQISFLHISHYLRFLQEIYLNLSPTILIWLRDLRYAC